MKAVVIRMHTLLAVAMVVNVAYCMTTLHPDITTTAAAESTTSTAETTTVANNTNIDGNSTTMALGVCPEGLFIKEISSVLFTMDDKNCEVSVQLSQPSDERGMSKKSGKSGKGRGKELSRKQRGWLVQNISIRPINNLVADECSHVSWRRLRPDSALIWTPDCFMMVMRNSRWPSSQGRESGSGKVTLDDPLIVTQPHKQAHRQ